jgi:hypothetical protein
VEDDHLSEQTMADVVGNVSMVRHGRLRSAIKQPTFRLILGYGLLWLAEKVLGTGMTFHIVGRLPPTCDTQDFFDALDYSVHGMAKYLSELHTDRTIV